MTNSLKKKFTTIYITLVVIIIIVGIVSTINMYKIKTSTDIFIGNNYKSINTINNMTNCIYNQDKAILIYLQGNKEEALNLFHVNDDEFYKWFYIEKGNITEPGEIELIDTVNLQYIEFSKSFSSLQDYNNGQNHEELVKIYEKTITNDVVLINKSLQELKQLNEDAMFKKQQMLKANGNSSIYFVMFVSIIGAIIGGSIAMFLTNRYFNPIHLLINAVKSVKEGNLNKQAPVIYQDEVGLLAKEFNNMTNRLHDFEKNAEDYLMAEKNKSLSIIKSISDPIILLDNEYKVQFINDEGQNFFDINEKKFTNRALLEIINLPEVYEYIRCETNLKYEDKEKIIEIKRNNKKYFFNLTLTIIKGPEEKVNGVVVLFKNITSLKELEIVKANFIGTISHELKTPLTSIMMGIGLINNSSIGVLNEKQQNIVETIKEDTQKLNELVSNLLKISQIHSNSTTFNMKISNVNELIESCATNFKTQAIDKGLDIMLDLEKELPEAKIDEEKIKWVLNNLVSNAIRYTEKGSVKLKTYVKNKKIYICVIDTGRGIPNNYLEKVFEKFVRVEGFEIPEESTGLGLSIAKEVVEMHEGKIWCESELGFGSKFIFTIPLS
ncbi:ATP-binding protein [Clostridium sartagoforme]